MAQRPDLGERWIYPTRVCVCVLCDDFVRSTLLDQTRADLGRHERGGYLQEGSQTVNEHLCVVGASAYGRLDFSWHKGSMS